MGLFSPVNFFLFLVKKRDNKKVYFSSFAILGKPALEYKSPFSILGECCERYGQADKKVKSCVYYRIYSNREILF